jgi:enterochelin esterase-like enzyme
VLVLAIARALGAVALLLVLTAAPAAAEGSGRRFASVGRVEQHTFSSLSLDRRMPYAIWLPPGYDDEPYRRYPVLYALHGMGGSNSEWMGYGLDGAADGLIQAGEIAPLIIVFPQGDQGYWFDNFRGPRWGTYLARDVVAEVDARFRTIADREQRAVGGLSMGALGALQIGINYPDVFAVVGAHGPPLRDFATAVEWLGPDMVGDAAYFARFDPLELFARRPSLARTLRIQIDVGAADTTWRPIATAFHLELERVGVPHRWIVLPGHHSGDEYWRPHAPIFLRFYDAALRPPPERSLNRSLAI